MKSKKIIIIAALFLIVINLSGCIGVDRSFRHISTYIVENTDSKFSKEYEFSIGSTGITLATLFVSFADTDEPIDEILSEISNVQVGIYSNDKPSKVTLNYSGLRRITNLMERAGWEYIVRTVDEDELTAVFVRIYEEQLNRVFVISINEEEMVLVELYGNIDKVVEIAIREGELNIQKTKH